MKARLLIASSSEETGALLKEYLEQRGVTIDPTAKLTISYGVPSRGALGDTRPPGRPPGSGKIYNMQQMNRSGVRTVPWFQGANVPDGFQFPLLARAEHGYGGEDLAPVFQPEEVEWRVKSGWSWFSQFIPIAQEYRVWMFRDEHLGTYKKNMERPHEFKYIGRNFRNGFDFVKAEEEADVTDIARRAVQCLKLDWAAVDLIRGKDGLLYILETNTAPGAIKSGAQATLGLLADRITSWVAAESKE